MNEQITVEIFNHLVDLAALELSQEQGDYLRKQLNNQLKVIDELKEIPLEDNVPINLHGVPYSKENSSLPREDVWVPYPDPQEILAQSPLVEDGYIIVPDIPHTTLK
ncbi:MAG: aspartyl/glutamyl-tRNA amidotransferase subunit C [Chloroflexi bacterium]|nr:aspartyl/glutamyl-tRNA amidotransferase subunit C [Chloroflexota bacterium]